MLHVLDLAIETLEGREDRVGCDEASDADAFRDRPKDIGRAPLHGEEVPHEDPQHIGQAQHAQRRARRRAIHDAHIGLAAHLHFANRP